MTRRHLAVVIAFLAGVSLLIQGHGAWSRGVVEWNVIPNNVDRNRTRLWDWRDPQFLRGPRSAGAAPTSAKAPKPDSVSTIPLSTLVGFEEGGDGLRYLWQNWSMPEDWGVWSDGTDASLRFRITRPGASLQLRLRAQGFESKTGKKQPITVLFEGREVAKLELGTSAEWYNIALPLSAFVDGTQTYRLVFHVGAPTSPAQRDGSTDARRLGVGLSKLIIQEP